MTDNVTRQLGKAITGSPAQVPLKPPQPVGLTRGTIAGVNVEIAGVKVTTVQLPGSSQAVPAEVSIGYGAKVGDVVDILTAPPRLIVLGPTSVVGGTGGFPNLIGEGSPIGVDIPGYIGEWYEDNTNGVLYKSLGTGADDWTVVNPGVLFGFYEFAALEMEFGFDNSIAADSGLIMAIGWENVISSGNNAIAIGYNNSVGGTGVAVGVGNVVESMYATALGNSCTAAGIESVAIGYGADASLNYQIALGNFDTFVTISNLLSIYTYSTDPNGMLTSNLAGDLCITPLGLYQAAADFSTVWVLSGGGGGGSYASLTGTGEGSSPGDLTQLGGLTVQDNAGDGITFISGGDQTTISVSDGAILLESDTATSTSTFIYMTDSFIRMGGSTDGGVTYDLPISAWTSDFVVTYDTSDNIFEASWDGTNTKIAFHGVTPVVQAAAPTTLAQVITLLTNVGLCA